MMDSHSLRRSSQLINVFCKGVVWLILASLAEAPVVVCSTSYTSPCGSSVHRCSTAQVLIILDLNCSSFLSMAFQ